MQANVHIYVICIYNIYNIYIYTVRCIYIYMNIKILNIYIHLYNITIEIHTSAYEPLSETGTLKS